MDEFTEIVTTEFAMEANDYLDKLLTGFMAERLARALTCAEPPTVMEISKRILGEIRPDNFTNISVALATAMFRLTEMDK